MDTDQIITIKPQVLEREVQSRDDNGALWCHNIEYRTGWWKATTNEGLHALGQTASGAVAMIERMRNAR